MLETSVPRDPRVTKVTWVLKENEDPAVSQDPSDALVTMVLLVPLVPEDHPVSMASRESQDSMESPAFPVSKVTVETPERKAPKVQPDLLDPEENLVKLDPAVSLANPVLVVSWDLKDLLVTKVLLDSADLMDPPVLKVTSDPKERSVLLDNRV